MFKRIRMGMFYISYCFPIMLLMHSKNVTSSNIVRYRLVQHLYTMQKNIWRIREVGLPPPQLWSILDGGFPWKSAHPAIRWESPCPAGWSHSAATPNCMTELGCARCPADGFRKCRWSNPKRCITDQIGPFCINGWIYGWIYGNDII